MLESQASGVATGERREKSRSKSTSIRNMKYVFYSVVATLVFILMNLIILRGHAQISGYTSVCEASVGIEVCFEKK